MGYFRFSIKYKFINFNISTRVNNSVARISRKQKVQKTTNNYFCCSIITYRVLTMRGVYYLNIILNKPAQPAWLPKIGMP